MTDYINRQAVIDAIFALPNYTVEWLARAVDKVDALPSAQSEACEGCKNSDKWRNEIE